MSAREDIRWWLGQNFEPGDEQAKKLLDTFASDLLHGAAEAAAEIHQHCHRTVCAGCEVRRDILDVLHSVADVIGDKDSSTAPGPTGRVAQLLDAIRAARGRWTTVTAFRFYRDHVRATDSIPNTQLRAVARGDLRDLAAWGHLIRHEEPGRQYYVLKTGKGGA